MADQSNEMGIRLDVFGPSGTIWLGPTPELRWFNGRLQQTWEGRKMEGHMIASYEREWRDVPVVLIDAALQEKQG